MACGKIVKAWRCGEIWEGDPDPVECDECKIDRLSQELAEARAELSSLRSAPVAVEVLDPPKREKDCGDCVQIAHCNGALACACGLTGKMFIRKEVSPQPIRILKDGEREELEILRKIADEWCPPFGVPQIPRTKKLFAQLKALRSSREGAE